LDFAKPAGLLDATQAGQHGIEEVQQDQRAILIEKQLPVASAVSLGTGIVQFLQQRLQNVEILKGLKILLGELRLAIAELFAERLLLPPFVFTRWNDDGLIPLIESTAKSRLRSAILPTWQS
jgi:hypothetical protein